MPSTVSSSLDEPLFALSRASSRAARSSTGLLALVDKTPVSEDVRKRMRADIAADFPS